MSRIKDSFLNYLALFGSVGTLVCCALPALLVSLGLGAVMAGMAANIPGLIWVSENKTSVFIFSGLLLLFNGVLIWLNRNAPCPVDPILRQACIKGRKSSKFIYFLSLTVFLVGFTFVYVLPYI
jgi:hypothetical protein